MNYTAAKNNIFWKRLFGTAISVLCAAVVLIGILKFLYFGLDSAGSLLAPLALMVKRGVYAIYEKTQFLSLLWEHVPVPNLNNPFAPSNIVFFIWYFGFFVGASLFASASRLSARLKRISQQIEDELIRESIQSPRIRSRAEIQDSISVSTQPAWKEFHTLYVAPIIVGVILLALGKLLGLT